MNELKIFSYEGTEIRTVQHNGETWWVLKDVCRALELSNPTIVAARLDDDERAKLDLGRQGETNIINESGLYSVILRSDKPEARKFKRWVTHEVLPSIRKHGAYMTPMTIKELVANPDLLMDMLLTLKAEQQAHAETASCLEDKTIQLDESKEWLTVKRVATLNGISWKDISWRILKTTSEYLQYEIKKIFDANYTTVNAYHIDVWRQEYPEFLYG